MTLPNPSRMIAHHTSDRRINTKIVDVPCLIEPFLAFPLLADIAFDPDFRRVWHIMHHFL